MKYLNCFLIFLMLGSGLFAEVPSNSVYSNKEKVVVKTVKKKVSNQKNAKDNNNEEYKNIFYPALVTFTVAGSFLTYGTISWWSSHEMAPFSFKYTYLLSERGYAGGADKMGHMFANYIGIQSLTTIYSTLGLSPKHSLYLASSLTFFLFTTVEIVDGFTVYQFEWEDVMFDNFGLAIGLLANIYPNLNEFFSFRISYFPSKDYVAQETADNIVSKYIQFVNDYSGMIFFMDFRFAGLKNIWHKNIYGLQFFSIGVNWSTEGYSPGREYKERWLGFHFGLDIVEVMNTMIQSKNSFLRYFKIFSKYFAFQLTMINYQLGLNHNTSQLSFGVNGRLIASF